MSYDGRNRLSAYTDSAGKSTPKNIIRCKQGPCPQPGAPKSLTYDARGNVIALGSTAFIYDLSDQPVRVTGAVNGTYVYDGNLKRVKSTVDGKTIYNVYNAAGSLVHVYDADTNEKTDYVRAGGMTVARASNQGDKFLHNDHLGSAASITDKSGQILGPVEHFTPYGEALTPNAANDNHAAFTGHIRDKATGLTYMQARYYDPVIGRFLSVDPVGFSPENPGSFNRYTYGLNDPINLIDPDGMQARPPMRRPRFRGDNMGPLLEHAKPIGPVRQISPNFRPAQIGFVRDRNSIGDWNNYISDVEYQYNVFGTGNLDGSRTSNRNETGGDVGIRTRMVLGNTTFDKTLGANGFQFQGSGGLSGAADAFRTISGQSLADGNNASLSIGNTDVNVNFHHSKTTGVSTVQINMSTSRTGSRIKAKTTVKIRFEEENK